MKKVIMLSSAMLMVLLLASCDLVKSSETSQAVPTSQSESSVAVDESMEKTVDDIVGQLAADAMMDKDEGSMDKMEEDKMMEEEVMMDKGDESMEKEEVMTKELAGSYSDYDASMLGKTENTVIFFHAPWCPSCRAADSGISGGEVPEGLTILKADFDSETDLRKKYSVVGLHTFVQVDADGNEVKKWLGGNSVAEVVERLQ